MSEEDAIARTSAPLTVAALAEQLQACGLAAGQIVLVHMAMGSSTAFSGACVAHLPPRLGGEVLLACSTGVEFQ
jgi:aminoglycoside N3'-acetyltransferase